MPDHTDHDDHDPRVDDDDPRVDDDGRPDHYCGSYDDDPRREEHDHDLDAYRRDLIDLIAYDIAHTPAVHRSGTTNGRAVYAAAVNLLAAISDEASGDTVTP
jgi:hypothetical protein